MNCLLQKLMKTLNAYNDNNSVIRLSIDVQSQCVKRVSIVYYAHKPVNKAKIKWNVGDNNVQWKMKLFQTALTINQNVLKFYSSNIIRNQ